MASAAKIRTGALLLVLFVTSICVFVPLSPDMPNASLDGAWIFAINQAVAQGMAIGRDTIFTFGPYAAIYTMSYHPALDSMILGSSLYLAVLYWACLAVIVEDAPWQAALSVCVILSCLMYSRDALLFSYPLLVALVVQRIVAMDTSAWRRSPLLIVFFGLLFSAFGLLVLIKGTLIVICAGMTGLCFLYLLLQRQRALALSGLAAFALSIPMFWMLAGQSIANLPLYFANIVPIVSGYTEAMALAGSPFDIVAFLVAAGALLFASLPRSGEPLALRIFAGAVFFLFLFIAFKSAFVRPDIVHVVTAQCGLLLAAAFVALSVRSSLVVPAVVLSILGAFYIDHHYSRTSTDDVVTHFRATYSNALSGFARRLQDRDWPKKDFDRAIDSMRSQQPLSLLNGTSDIYSFNQSALIASGNRWSPRPVFQSYSAYTPSLVEDNRQKLLGPDAPANLFFRIETIDGRMPSLDDGASWPVLLALYRLVGQQHGYLQLARNDVGRIDHAGGEMDAERHSFGDVVTVPPVEGPVFARFEIRPSLWGRFIGFLFKPAPLRISLTLDNGKKRNFLIVSGMVRSGLVLSPLIETTDEMGLLYTSPGALEGKRVRSFVVDAQPEGSTHWRPQYEIIFSPLRRTPESDRVVAAGFNR